MTKLDIYHAIATALFDTTEAVTVEKGFDSYAMGHNDGRRSACSELCDKLVATLSEDEDFDAELFAHTYTWGPLDLQESVPKERHVLDD